jgi:predicted RNA methylase
MALHQTTLLPLPRVRGQVLSSLRQELAAGRLTEQQIQESWFKALTSAWPALVKRVNPITGIKTDMILSMQSRNDSQPINVLFEFKRDAPSPLVESCSKALVQCLIYLQKLSANRLAAPIYDSLMVVCVVAHDRVWTFPVPILKSHLSKIEQPSLPASSAWKGNPAAMASLMSEEALKPFFSNIIRVPDLVFTLESLHQRIMSCQSTLVFQEPVDSSNVFLWFVKFRTHVLEQPGAVEADNGDDIRVQQAAFVALLRAASVEEIWHAGNIILSSGGNNRKLLPAPRNRVDEFLAAFRRVATGPRGIIISQLDTLLDRCLSQLRHGDYYTPQIWVAEADQLAKAHIDLDWAQNCIVWDCSCGTGNLTAEIPFSNLCQTTLFDTDVGLVEARGTSPNRKYLGAFDFLTSVDDVPREIESLIKSADPSHPIVFFNNPPFKTGANFESTTSKSDTSGVADTGVGRSMKSLKPPLRASNLYIQFLYKMTRLAEQWTRQKPSRKIYNLVFLPTNAWSGSQECHFFQFYFQHWQFLSGFAFPASDFTAVKGDSWSVCCTLWEYRHDSRATLPSSITLALMEVSHEQVVQVGETIATSSSPSDMLNKWLKEFNDSKASTRPALPLSNAMTISEGTGRTTMAVNAIGYFVNSTDAIKQNCDQVYLLSSVRRAGHGCDVLRMPSTTLTGTHPLLQFRHLLRASAVFFARRSILPSKSEMWKVWHIDYQRPRVDDNNMNNDSYLRWAVGCAVFSLFDHQRSLQASMRNMSFGANHFSAIANEWFPFAPTDVREWATRAKWSAMLDDLDRFGSSPRFVCELLTLAKSMLSEEAINLLSISKAVFESTMELRRDRSQDDLKSLQLHCWDAGWFQLKSLITSESQSAVRVAHGRLRKVLLPGIVQFGFLPMLPPLNEFQTTDIIAGDELMNVDDIDDCLSSCAAAANDLGSSSAVASSSSSSSSSSALLLTPNPLRASQKRGSPASGSRRKKKSGESDTDSVAPMSIRSLSLRPVDTLSLSRPEASSSSSLSSSSTWLDLEGLSD